MIIDMSDMPLFEEWQAAHLVENAAITALHDAMKNGNRDMSTLETLTTQMEDAHNKAMDIYDRLRKRRLDKD